MYLLYEFTTLMMYNMSYYRAACSNVKPLNVYK